tara:strand:+ start:769 stop:975 length:207 start_codon:yes stop_codon:yes gene_type:complete
MKRAKLNTSGPPGTAASYATHFSAAITRMPADTAVDGLRAVDTGAIDIELRLNSTLNTNKLYDKQVRL